MCHAVCFLERDFPISFHAPTVPREVLACAKCLIGSSEVLQRQLLPERLVHGFNCLAVRNVHDTEALASIISMGLDDAQRADALGRRGHEYSVSIERTRKFPSNYEELFADVIKRHNKGRVHDPSIIVSVTDRFTWTRRALDTLPPKQRKIVDESVGHYDEEEGWALGVYACLLELVGKNELAYGVLIDAVRLELRLAGVFNSERKIEDGLFRLESKIPVLEQEMDELYPIIAGGLEIDAYEFDVRELLAARLRGELPLWASRHRSRALVLAASNCGGTRVYWLSPSVEALLELCDGSRSIGELRRIVRSQDAVRDNQNLGAILMDCFRLGIIRLLAEPTVSSDPQSAAIES